MRCSSSVHPTAITPHFAGQAPAHISRRCRRRQQLLTDPPCGEARSANRMRWTSSDAHPDDPSSQQPAVRAQHAYQGPARQLHGDPAGAAPGAATVLQQDAGAADEGAAQPDTISSQVTLPVQPPMSNGNGALAMDIPVTMEDAAALVRTASSSQLQHLPALQKPASMSLRSCITGKHLCPAAHRCDTGLGRSIRRGAAVCRRRPAGRRQPAASPGAWLLSCWRAARALSATSWHVASCPTHLKVSSS